MTRKTYNDEFKIAAAKLVRQQGILRPQGRQEPWRRRGLHPRLGPQVRPRGRRSQVRRRTRGPRREPRVYRALKARSVACSENTVATLMRAQGVRAKARRPFVIRHRCSRHDRSVSENVLNREL